MTLVGEEHQPAYFDSGNAKANGQEPDEDVLGVTADL